MKFDTQNTYANDKEFEIVKISAPNEAYPDLQENSWELRAKYENDAFYINSRMCCYKKSQDDGTVTTEYYGYHGGTMITSRSQKNWNNTQGDIKRYGVNIPRSETNRWIWVAWTFKNGVKKSPDDP